MLAFCCLSGSVEVFVEGESVKEVSKCVGIVGHINDLPMSRGRTIGSMPFAVQGSGAFFFWGRQEPFAGRSIQSSTAKTLQVREIGDYSISWHWCTMYYELMWRLCNSAKSRYAAYYIHIMCKTVCTYILTWRNMLPFWLALFCASNQPYVSLSFLEARNLVRVQAPVPGDFDCRVWDSGKGMKLDVPPRFTFILPNCAENSVQTPCVFIDLFCTQTQ